MSSQPPSASQQTGKAVRTRARRTVTAGSQRGGNSQVYLHSVTDAQATVLTENKRQEIKQKTGADVELDPNPSDVQNTKIVIVQGSFPQIVAAVRLINHGTGIQGTISAQAQAFWQQWVEATFPDLESRAYFLPPVYFNRVPRTRQWFCSQEIWVLGEAPGQHVLFDPRKAGQPNQPMVNTFAGNKSVQPANVQDSDVRDDAAMQRFLFCLQKMSEENGEVLVGLSQLQFGQYLGELCYSAAAAHLPVAGSLPAALSKNKRGDFDVLLIHRQYGIVVCEVKAFGDNVGKLKMSQQDIDKNVRSKLTNAVSQLDKAEAMLSHLVSDVTLDLRITKTIALPSLTARQVQQAISGDTKLLQELCQCLGTTDPADITGLCVCSDQLSDPKTPWDVSSDVLRELGNWWQRRVAVSGPDSHMTCDNYKTLVARFCGPATTVTVPCASPPRLCVKTLGQAVSWTGECYTAQISLFPEQLDLINRADPRVFICGPPGTGKTVVLLLMATEWLRCGNDVHIVGAFLESHPACTMLYHLLLHIVNTQLTSVVSPGQPHLLQYDFNNLDKKHVQKAVDDLSQAARSGSLYVIADELIQWADNFQWFCLSLRKKVPRLHLWAASCYYAGAPTDCHIEYLTRSLRSPPAVVREVLQDKTIAETRVVHAYSERSVAEHADGPPVRRVYHRGQGHTVWTSACFCNACGREVASFLHSLRIPVNSTTSTTLATINSSTTPPSLQWKDVLVVWYGDLGDTFGFVKGLKEGGVPVRMMADGDVEDVVTARTDVVWTARGDRARGLERKVVVCVDSELESSDLYTVRLHWMSRCTSQLVIVSPDSQPTGHEPPSESVTERF